MKMNDDKYEVEIQKYLNENIVLYNEDNEPFEFEKVAIITLDDQTEDHMLYHVLKPVSQMGDISEDEVLIFGYEDNLDSDDEGIYYIVEDEQIANDVMETFYRILEEEEQLKE